MLGHRNVAKCPPSLIEIKRDGSYFQVVVVRNPRDTAISCVAHSEFRRPGSGRAVRSAIVHTLRDYCDTIDYFLENLDYINLYDFEYLDWALIDIANKAKIEIPDTFVLTPKHYSMKDTDFYQKLFRAGIDDSLFEEANDKYQTILSFCQRPNS